MRRPKIVELLTLRVLVSGNDIEGWMAQGLEIDYFACGRTEESVRDKFFKGLIGTIELYLEVNEEALEDFLSQPAPKEVWREYRKALSGNRKRLSIQVEVSEEMLEATTRPLSGQVSFFAPIAATA